MRLRCLALMFRVRVRFVVYYDYFIFRIVEKLVTVCLRTIGCAAAAAAAAAAAVTAIYCNLLGQSVTNDGRMRATASRFNLQRCGRIWLYAGANVVVTAGSSSCSSSSSSTSSTLQYLVGPAHAPVLCSTETPILVHPHHPAPNPAVHHGQACTILPI